MIERIERSFRALRRRLSRSEWAVRLLGLPVSENTRNAPGLILIQIDGLARRQMERAMERGRLRFLRTLVRSGLYRTRTFYSGIPSNTPAVQGELHYGIRSAVPAFSFLDPDSGAVTNMFHPESARKIERELASQNEGLLKGGSSWSNIYTGGASNEESHFCFAALGIDHILQARSLLSYLAFPLLHLPSLIRMAGLIGLEILIAFRDVFKGVAKGEKLAKELKFVFARVGVCIGIRELVTIGVKIDTARGLPIIHANFLGYDEQAHRRGPSSAFAHWSLKGIDRAIKHIYRTARRSTRRHYEVWIFSDHGQEATRHFTGTKGETIQQVIRQALHGAGSNPPTPHSEHPEPVHPSRANLLRRRSRPARKRSLLEDLLPPTQDEEFTLAAMGPIGHLYLHKPLGDAERRRFAIRLVRAGVPGVLIPRPDGGVDWFHSKGTHRLPNDASEQLPHPDTLKKSVANDLVGICTHKFAGNLLLLGWSPESPPLSFADERGAHAGPGPDETQGFLLLPARTRLPDEAAAWVRPEDLRAAALHYLNRRSLKRKPRTRPQITRHRLRVMTYNVHGCRGLDGRVLTSRIASVIEHYEPDLVALQELDLGRVRSQHDDQPRLIAEALEMHHCFCPTVIVGGEQYGHALLAHCPMETVRTQILEGGPRAANSETRGALWVRLSLDGLQINLMNTHFGLGRHERVAQVADLLGPNWIGAIDEDEPLIVCGDFNMIPWGAPYRAIIRRLRDVQTAPEHGAPLHTFSSLQPFARLDHIFVSRHFTTTKRTVPRNHLTRVASDHLPLIVDLKFQTET